MPVFILMIFGVIEFSGVVMTKTGANSAVKSGARMAIVSGNDAMADRNILLRMAKDGSGISQDHIDWIKVWRASSPDASTPGTCNASTHCNFYNDPQDSTQGAFHLAKLPPDRYRQPGHRGQLRVLLRLHRPQ